MRDGEIKGGLESGCCYKEKISDKGPSSKEALKPNQMPPHEKDKSAERGHKLRSNQ